MKHRETLNTMNRPYPSLPKTQPILQSQPIFQITPSPNLFQSSFKPFPNHPHLSRKPRCTQLTPSPAPPHSAQPAAPVLPQARLAVVVAAAELGASAARPASAFAVVGPAERHGYAPPPRRERAPLGSERSPVGPGRTSLGMRNRKLIDWNGQG